MSERETSGRPTEGETDAAETETDDGPTLEEATREALHQVELGSEWLQRANGHLVAFHHGTGHAMDHFARAEQLLRESGHETLADELRDQLLPRGVVDGDRWSYDVVEDFQSGLLADVQAYARRVRADVADGRRHVAERRQEREWKRRSETYTGERKP